MQEVLKRIRKHVPTDKIYKMFYEQAESETKTVKLFT